MLKGKLLAAASDQATTPPPVTNDTYEPENPVVFAIDNTTSTNYVVNNIGMCSGRDATHWVVGGTINGVRTLYSASKGNSYADISNAFSMTATAGNISFMSMAAVTSSTFLCVYETASTALKAQYITISGANTFTATVGETTVCTTASNVAGPLCVVFDSSNALVYGATTTIANSRFALINPTTLAVTQASTSAAAVTQSNTRMGLVKVSSTMAIFSWQDSGNLLKFATVDIVSGVSATLNANVNSTKSCIAGGKCYPINSTTVLCVYTKSSTQIGAFTMTVGVGGSITFNTEYVYSPTRTVGQFTPFDIAAYGTGPAYISGFHVLDGVGNNSGHFALSMTVVGTVITFDTNGAQALETYNGGSVANNIYTGAFLTLDATHVAVTYSNVSSSGPNATTGVIDVTPSTQVWNSFPASASAYSISGTTASTYVEYPAVVWMGTNRLFSGASVAAGSLFHYPSYNFGGTGGYGLFGTGVDTAVSTARASMIPLTLAVSTGKSRAMTAYANTTNNIHVGIVSVARAGDAAGEENAGASIDTGAGSGIDVNKNGWYALMPLTTSTALCVNYNNNNSGRSYFASVVTVDPADPLLISAVSTNAAIITDTGNTLGNGRQFLQYSVIDSSNIAVVYQVLIAGVYSLKCNIIHVSGTTVTIGTPQTVISGYTNTPTFGIAAFPVSSTGVIWYTNDASPGTSLLAKGFTYSGNNITLGTATTLDTGKSITNVSCGNGNPSATRISNTTAAICYKGGSNMQVRIITYNSINSTSVSSETSPGAVTNYGFLIPTDNFNRVFGVYYDGSYKFYYR